MADQTPRNKKIAIRRPPAFNATMIEEFAEGEHEDLPQPAGQAAS